MNKKIVITIIIITIVFILGIIFLINTIADFNNVSTLGIYIEDSTIPIYKEDIIKTKLENEARYNEEYEDKKVRFKGTVLKIQTGAIMYGINVKADTIYFEEGWQLSIPTGSCKTLSKLNKGDIVEVTSRIRSVSPVSITVYDYGNNTNNSSIKYKGEEICTIQ